MLTTDQVFNLWYIAIPQSTCVKMVSQIELELDRNTHVSGSNIKGDLILILSKQERIQSINIILSGRACTEWTVPGETECSGYGGGYGGTDCGMGGGYGDSCFYSTGFDNRHRRKPEVYVSTEEIFKDTLLRLCDNGDVYQLVPPGVHRFPFQFWLPSRCPSSFESQFGYGSIRYMLTATVFKAKKEKTMKWNITVNDLVDINSPWFIQPQTVSDAETVVGLCSCIAGTISLSVTTDRRGYCVGETIAVTIKAKNNSRSRVTAMKVSLEQHATFIAYDQHRDARHETTVIQKIQGPGIRPGDTSTWVNRPLAIPTTVPTITLGIIQVSYHVTVVLAIRFSQDFRVAIPITIGSVPYQNNQ